MTDWQPTVPLDRRGVTKHKQLADAIVADIESGRLRHGQRLPPHRELALSLGVSVQTVSLSYKEVERLGYLSSEVGRGTFVKSRVTDRADRFMLDRSPNDLVDLSIVRAVYTDRHESAARALMAAMADGDNGAWMRPCRPVAGLDAHREIGRGWLRRLGVDAGTDRILITNGAAQGLFLAVATVVQPGDVVLTEELTDHGVIGMASVLGFTLRGLPTDAEGILPDAFDEACRAGPVRALVCIPTFTNPTAHLAGAERRRRIAEVARRHGVFVIEDEVYKPLLDEPLPSVADLVPEIGFFVTSFTKSVMTGLRTGYLVVPPQLSIRAASILRVTGWSGTAVVAEMAARWIEDGTADDLLAVQRAEVRARQAIVAATLGDLVAGSHPLSLGVWLKIPDHWNEETLIRVLRERGVAATPSEPFVAGADGKARRGMRLCVGGRMGHADLQRALDTVRSTCLQLPPINETGFLS
ncbi:MocR-like ectoine utilization transcription factor EhuR [Azospirillum sp. A39]|uniref:MocR-like ectoine utilization transcription factor EhuR n=1 Tax=Azospirillum sp. A39 TaxID=3462279 RepID=UPI0040462400